MNEPTNVMDAAQAGALATKVVDHASQQSDRWLFVAALVCGGLALFFAAKWLTSQYQKMLEQWRTDILAMQKELRDLHNERITAVETYAAELRQIIREQGENGKSIAKLMADVVAENARAIGSIQAALRDVQVSCNMARMSIGVPPGFKSSKDPSDVG